MVGVGTRLRRQTGLIWCLAILGVIGLSICGLGASASLERLEFDIERNYVTPEGADPVPADAAVVGDTVQIAAVLRPTSEDGTTDDIRVDFYYENRITRETGFIGSAVVPGFYAAAGTVRRAIYEWDLKGESPGVYGVFAVGDFDISLPEPAAGETVADVEVDPERNPALELLKVLQQGRFIAFPLDADERLLNVSGVPVFEACMMGEDVGVVSSGHVDPSDGGIYSKYRNNKIQRVGFVNLGTETITLASFEPGTDDEETPRLRCWYRELQQLKTGPELTAYRELSNAVQVVDPSKSENVSAELYVLAKPGEEGTLPLYIRFPFEFETAARLADTKQVQLRIQAYGSASGENNEVEPISDYVYLPGRTTYSDVYSWTDLWTFPEREGCCSDCEVSDGWSVTVPPVVVERRGTVPSLAGEQVLVVLHAVNTGDTSRLYAHEIGPTPESVFINASGRRWNKGPGGQEQDAWEPQAGETIAALTATENQDGELLAFVATSDGNAYAIQDTAEATSGFFANQDFVEVWGPVALPGSGELEVLDEAFVVGSDSGTVVFVTSRGLFAYAASEGTLEWQMTDPDRLPIVAAANAGNHIWFASSDAVYAFSVPTLRGEVGNVADVISATLSSGIVAATLGDDPVAVFADEGGYVMFHDAETGRLFGDKEPVCTRCDFTAVTAAGGSADTAVVYAAEKRSGMYRLEKTPGGDEWVETLKPSSTILVGMRWSGNPTGLEVLASSGELEVVFLTTDQGELRSLVPDLSASVRVLLWPKFDDDGVNQNAEVQSRKLREYYATFEDPVANVLTRPVLASLSTTGEGSSAGLSLLQAVFVGGDDGLLYAFDLTRAGRETFYWPDR
jgi:hypothetical protein